MLAEGTPLYWKIMIKDLESIGQAKVRFTLTERVIIHWRREEEEIVGTDTLNLGVGHVHGGNYRFFESLRHNDEFLFKYSDIC
jgi:hypothetical protein